jgi:hypothetical protein
MTRAATFTIAAIAFLCTAEAATLPPVTFVSLCSCRDALVWGGWTMFAVAALLNYRWKVVPISLATVRAPAFMAESATIYLALWKKLGLELRFTTRREN